MGRRRPLLLLLPLAALSLLGLATALRGPPPEVPPGGALRPPGAAGPERPVFRGSGPPAGSTGSAPAGRSSDGWPAELAAADRERDLFGVVVDSAGRAVPGARVRSFLHPWRGAGLLTGDRDAERGAGPEALTGPSGAFRLRLEPGRTVTLEVEAAGFASVALPDRAAGERVRVELGPGVVVRIVARTADGHPAVGARLRVGPGGPLAQSLVTDARGRAVSSPVAVPSVGAAGLRVEVPVQPGWAWASDRHPVPAGARELDLALTLARARTLTGRVTDAATGAPVPGATVGLGWTHEAPVATDADGRYEQPAVPSDGYHELSVRASGYATEQRPFGEASPLDFALQREATLTGRAVDERGRALAGVRVVANGSRFEGHVQATSFGDALSGPDGAFAVGGLRSALPHEVVLRHPGFGRANVVAPAVGVPGATRDLGEVVLRAGRTLAVRVEGSTGEARAGAEVTLFGPREAGAPPLEGGYGRTETARADDLGRARFADLSPGRYLLRALEREPIAASRELTLAQDDLLDVVLVLPRGRRLRLVALDPEGAPVPELSVRLRWDGGARNAWVGGSPEPDLVLPEGARRVVLQAEAERSDLLPLERVEVADDATELRLVFPRAEVVAGRLLDGEGRGLAQARVEVRRGTQVLGSAWTEDEGAFEVGFPGRGRVDVAYEGVLLTHDGDGWPLSLRRPEAALLAGVEPGARDLRLLSRPTPADGVLVLRVRDPGGRPAPGVSATLTPTVGRAPAEPLVSDADGHLRFQGLPPGAYGVRLGVPEAQREAWFAPEPSGLRPGGEVHEARLGVPRMLGVLTLRSDGSPLRGASVTAVSEGRSDVTGTTDAEGRLRLALDPEVGLRVDLEAWATDADGGLWHAEPTQAPAGEGPLVLRLAPHDGIVR